MYTLYTVHIQNTVIKFMGITQNENAPLILKALQSEDATYPLAIGGFETVKCSMESARIILQDEFHSLNLPAKITYMGYPIPPVVAYIQAVMVGETHKRGIYREVNYFPITVGSPDLPTPQNPLIEVDYTRMEDEYSE